MMTARRRPTRGAAIRCAESVLLFRTTKESTLNITSIGVECRSDARDVDCYA